MIEWRRNQIVEGIKEYSQIEIAKTMQIDKSKKIIKVLEYVIV